MTTPALVSSRPMTFNTRCCARRRTHSSRRYWQQNDKRAPSPRRQRCMRKDSSGQHNATDEHSTDKHSNNQQALGLTSKRGPSVLEQSCPPPICRGKPRRTPSPPCTRGSALRYRPANGKLEISLSCVPCRVTNIRHGYFLSHRTGYNVAPGAEPVFFGQMSYSSKKPDAHYFKKVFPR